MSLLQAFSDFGTFEKMSDNGAIANMEIADGHFGK
jgi:hypothetical protein